MLLFLCIILSVICDEIPSQMTDSADAIGNANSTCSSGTKLALQTYGI